MISSNRVTAFLLSLFITYVAKSQEITRPVDSPRLSPMNIKITNDPNAYTIAKKNADLAWENMPTFNWNGSVTKESYERFRYEKELFTRAYRRAGMNFWMLYPDDPRCYQWLFKTMSMPIYYWLNIKVGAEAFVAGSTSIPIDSRELEYWNNVYPYMRREYLSSSIVNDSLKRAFRRIELWSYLHPRGNSEYNRIYKLSLDSLKQLFLSSIASYYNPKHKDKDNNFNPIIVFDQLLFNRSASIGLSNIEMEFFMKSIKNLEYPEVKNWIAKKLTILNLRNRAFELKYHTIHEEKIDLNNFRGKIVLLDFWATWCGVCIAKMPSIKELYKKYKNDGFEVISICINPERDKKAVLEIEKRISAGWPTLLIGGHSHPGELGGLTKEIWNTYGFLSVPQLILLDKDGLMVAQNGILLYGSMEPLLIKLLKENAIN